MEESYSIKDGRTECVMWIVLKDDKFIVERRPSTEQGESICIPCGHIDLNQDKGNDYVQSAFLRESKEEFVDGNFIPTQFYFLKTIDFDELTNFGEIAKLRLHYFVITDWEGSVPLFTIENEEKYSDLIWYSLPSFNKLPQSCDKEAIKELIKVLKVKFQ